MPRLKNVNRDSLSAKTDGVGSRVGSRLKKAKVVFDPSINNLPKKITRSLSVSGDTLTKTKASNISELKKHEKQSNVSSSLDNHSNDCCMLCGKPEIKKLKKFVTCKDCSYKVHSSCLKINYVNHALLEEHWRCDNCRTCVVCYETSEVGPLISCCVCVDAYHLSCHTPKLQKSINRFKWECSKCQNIEKNTVNRKFSEARKRLSPISSDIGITKKITKESGAEGIIERHDSSLMKANVKTIAKSEDAFPDISEWSSDRVSKYLEREFPNEAAKFREHDIDGASLMVLKRSDIIRGLSLKLGPAIRIYSRIAQLQSKSNDPRLTWM